MKSARRDASNGISYEGIRPTLRNSIFEIVGIFRFLLPENPTFSFPSSKKRYVHHYREFLRVSKRVKDDILKVTAISVEPFRIIPIRQKVLQCAFDVHWGPFGTNSVPFRTQWVPFETNLVPLGTQWVPFRTQWVSFVTHRVPFTTQWVSLGTHWDQFKTHWVPFGTHWAPFGTYWVLFGTHWVTSGTNSVVFGTHWI